MYDYEYENDVLLFLRLLKFLHTEHPFALEQIIKDYPTADEEDIWMILDELLMAVFDEGAPDEGDDMMTVRFSDERIDRLYTQGCKHSEILPYTVLAAKVQGGMSGSNTLVNLETPEKKQLYAYVRGARPELVSGVQLSHVKLTTRKQDTVIFYVLETYEVFRSEQQAA